MKEEFSLFDIDISLSMTLAGGKVKISGSANFHEDYRVTYMFNDSCHNMEETSCQ